jgi:hypothetical protein
MVNGTPSNKPEFPPLLVPGRHNFSLAELRKLCVDLFPLSVTRQMIMIGLENVFKELQKKQIQGELWVDGSFVTQKINPNDVDIVLRVQANFYDNGTQEQRSIVDWLGSNLKDSHYCDSYFFTEWPETHANYWVGHYMYNYWMKQFGFSRGNSYKGIPVLPL